ncbi:sulfotransferase domain-containing protein [Magnetococcus sp. PR-3]|uniref:sulfotransferase domain-containing protein n=1 Tax=Magnetococcus sp. PR-3 TaxID=3120355 RepID=UPI002FCDF828
MCITPLAADDEGLSEIEQLALFRDALSAHKAGRIQQAAEGYRHILKTNPDHVDVLCMFSRILQEAGDHDQAKDMMERVLSQKPDHVPTLVRLGMLLVASKESTAQGIHHLGQVLMLAPETKGINLKLGQICLDMDSLDQAISYLMAELALDPDNASLHYTVGRAYSRYGYYKEAAPFLHQAMALDPSSCRHTLPRTMNVVSQALPSEKPEKFILCSFQKCGTYLMSDILQAMTGQTHDWPSATQNQLSRHMQHNMGEDQFLVGHWEATPDFVQYLRENNYRVIVQLRDPRDQLVSFYYYYSKILGRENRCMTNYLKNLDKKSALTTLMLGLQLDDLNHGSQYKKLISWVRQWQESGLPLFFSRYEDLVMNKAQAVEQLADFLQVPMLPDAVLQIVKQTTFEGRSKTMEATGQVHGFKRKGAPGDWKNHFDDSLKQITKQMCGHALIGWGYEKDFNW